ncbi:hypothetical protein [Azospirillum sp. A39]|uniref:hypothetical protein n=1 Tax=Azospirillum sp. A39 TaxID=3462279 RepID=UPI004046213F
MPGAIASYRNRRDRSVRIHVSRTGNAENGQFSYVGDSGIGRITLTDPTGSTSTLVQLHEGSLDYTAKQVRKREFTAFCLSGTMIDTLAIKTMEAKPNGQGLGNVLVYHLADFAVSRGVGYVVALNVVARANMFYQRLGFRPYRSLAAVLEARGWAAGQDQGTWYAAYNRAQGTAYERATTSAARETIVTDLQTVRETLAEQHMIVEAAILRTNARTAWLAHWEAI